MHLRCIAMPTLLLLYAFYLWTVTRCYTDAAEALNRRMPLESVCAKTVGPTLSRSGEMQRLIQLSSSSSPLQEQGLASDQSCFRMSHTIWSCKTYPKHAYTIVVLYCIVRTFAYTKYCRISVRAITKNLQLTRVLLIKRTLSSYSDSGSFYMWENHSH